MTDVNNNLLIQADMILDLDVGVANYIKKEVRAESFFILSIIDNLNYVDLKEYLYNREKVNPLTVLCHDVVDSDVMDALYTDIMTNKYDKVVEYSTTFYPMIEFIYSTMKSNIPFKISCKSVSEVNRIRSIFSESDINNHILRYEELIDIDITDFDTIFINSYYDIIRYNLDNIGGKNIIVSDHKYNKVLQLNEYVLDPLISVLIVDKAVVSEIHLLPEPIESTSSDEGLPMFDLGDVYE